MKKSLSILFVFIFVFSGFTQKNTNYKYVTIPAKFSFLKEKNQYNLNALTKMYFEQLGFEVYFDDDQLAPKDFFDSNCTKLFADALEGNSTFSTKIKIILKDCKGNILYTSREGSNKEKEFKTAYNMAFRDALISLRNIKEEVFLKNSNNVNSNRNVNSKDNNNDLNISGLQLFAQPTNYGFQLIDKTPTIIYKIYKTSSTTVFIATKDSINGILISKNNQWFFEYYENEKLISEKVEVQL